jgi:hypothetical protein
MKDRTRGPFHCTPSKSGEQLYPIETARLGASRRASAHFKGFAAQQHGLVKTGGRLVKHARCYLLLLVT